MYAAGPGLVRRRYRDGRDATAEVAMMRWLHAHDYPVPQVPPSSSTVEEVGETRCDVHGPDLLMERIEGPTMAQALLAGGIEAGAAGELLAGLHNRLHALVHPDADDDQSVVHLDLHPLNVLLAAGGPVVIDWSNATLADPRLDVATALVIMAQATTVLPPELTGVDHDFLRAEITTLLTSLVAVVQHDPGPLLDEAAEQRRSDPHLSADELAGLDSAVAWARTLL